MFDNIRTEELPTLARALAQPYRDEEGVEQPAHNTEQVFAKLQAIEQMLSVRKVKTLMLRKRGFQTAIAGIMDNLVHELDDCEVINDKSSTDH